jgi:large subunit ribosomal protein L22
VRVSPRKARLVAQHLRGRTVPEARAVLAFTPRAAAREVELVLRSAVANAESNHGLIGDELVVVAAYVDEGPTIKRWRARARGRVASIHKRTCHITLKLAPAEGAARPTRRPAPVPAKAAAPTEEPRTAEEPQDVVERPAPGGEAAAEAPEPEAPKQPRRSTRKTADETTEETEG